MSVDYDGTELGIEADERRARAVLSNEAFKLLQEAGVFYMKAHEDNPISFEYPNLYHRLSSAVRR